ncbi:hypothetical protein KF913_05895 [Candidatus Obscuribacterales bacterium]|nr:hypothetical protein [Candidatus Obscuribacterales bacterium]
MAGRFTEPKLGIFNSFVTGLLFLSAHGAQASDFQDFRENSPGLDRHVLRQMFRQQNRVERADARASVREQRLLNVAVPAVSAPGESGRNNFDHRILTQIERGNTIEIGANKRVLKASTGLNFDLTSVERNIVIGDKLLGGKSVEITVGGETKSVVRGSKVTASEYLAVKQALGEGQTLHISRDGSASGGTLSIDALTTDSTMRASSLVISSGVTATGNFSKGTAFKLTGDLANFGTMLLASDKRGASLQGDDVLIGTGALVSAVGDLHVGASKTFLNNGSVTAGGALVVTAGDSIKNTSSLSADGGVTLCAASIENSGSVTSRDNDVNVYGPSTSALVFNNSGGVVNALNGSIIFREANYTGEYSTAITGGDLFSRTVNMNTGHGVMDLAVNNITGTVSQSGYAAHVSVDTDTLSLGNICLTGDPTYINAGGDINITGDVIAQEALVIIARNNVLVTSSGVSIIAGDSTAGFPVTILAGANITAGTANSPTVPTGATTTAATITGNGTGSVAGGSVLVTGINMTISTRSTGKKGSGGNVFIGAQKGTDLNSGTVSLSNVSISAGGRKSKDISGDVTIAAGGSADGSLIVGSIDTTGGTAGSGLITLKNSSFASSNGNPISWNAAGAVTSGNSLVTGTLVTGTASDVTVNGTVSSNADISIYSADDVLLSNTGLVRSFKGDVDVDGFARIFTFNGKFQADEGTVRLSAGDVGNNSNKINVISAGLAVTADVGAAYINSTGPVTVNEASSAVGTLSITSAKDIIANGPLNAGSVVLSSTDGDVIANGDITSTTAGISLASIENDVIVNGSLQSGAAATLSSQKGKIELGEAASITTTQSINISTEKGKILFGKSSSLEANFDGIFVTRESAMGSAVAAPKNTTVLASGGTVEFRGAQAKGKAPNNTVEATAGTIRIGSTKKNAITLAGGVTMLSQ